MMLKYDDGITLTDAEWDNIDPEIADFILAEAKDHLKEELDLSDKLDTKIHQILVISVGLMNALIAFLFLKLTVPITPLSGSVPTWLVASISLYIAALLIGSIILALALKPAGFRIGGKSPEKLLRSDVIAQKPHLVKLGEARKYGKRVFLNRNKIARKAKAINWSLGILIVSPAAISLIFLVTNLLRLFSLTN